MADIEMESVEAFRARARAWIEANLPREGEERVPDLELQNRIFDGGFAGIAFPSEYGGAGLTLEHQKAFYQEATGFQTPHHYGVSIGMLAATLVDHGSETLKKRHLPKILRGDEMWIQLLSEPSGGSDMAGAMTRATRDGDQYILNGSKMWSSGAATADYGMCLCRTDWDAPKHRGLSMIAVHLKDPRIVIEPTRGVVGGTAHFCQEFFDDVPIPAENLVGEENQGWAVAQTLLFHERNATAGVGHGYGLMGGEGGARDQPGGGVPRLIEAARRRGVAHDGAIRQLIAEYYVEQQVAGQANDRIMTGMRTGAFKGQWGSLLKLNLGMADVRRAEIAVLVHGGGGVIWEGDEPEAPGGNAGEAFLNSRTIAIAGGSNEMQRNIVSERLLGLPREPAFDRDLPFNEVLRNRASFRQQ
jgi:alkylation response protein AidB-like acyl-CoA dehydrogenase